MKIGIIAGSPRKNSESTRIGKFLEKKVQEKESDSYFLDLKENFLPQWHEDIYKENSQIKKVWQPISEELSSCDGFIVITPEWGGMATPITKNFFLLCSNHELAHKPGLIVSVSAGVSGAYPISELRASSYKNTQIVYTPDHLIFRFSNALLKNPIESLTEAEKDLRARIDYSIDTLLEYAKALELVRNSGKIDLKSYPYGM